MTRRDWLRAARRQEMTLSDVREAAIFAMRSVCGGRHELADCVCSDNQMTPLEFFDWLEREVHVANTAPVRFEPGGRPGRRRRDDEERIASGRV